MMMVSCKVMTIEYQQGVRVSGGVWALGVAGGIEAQGPAGCVGGIRGCRGGRDVGAQGPAGGWEM